MKARLNPCQATPQALPAVAALDADGQAKGIVDWLLGEEARALDDAGLVEGLGRRLRDAGLPLDRLSLHLRMLHPELIARTLAWAPGGAVESLDRPHGIEALALFANSRLLPGHGDPAAAGNSASRSWRT